MGRKESDIWSHFVDIGFEDGKKMRRIKCNYCSRTMVKNSTHASKHLIQYCIPYRQVGGSGINVTNNVENNGDVINNGTAAQALVARSSKKMPFVTIAAANKNAHHNNAQDSPLSIKAIAATRGGMMTASTTAVPFTVSQIIVPFKEQYVKHVGKISSSERLQRFFDSIPLSDNTTCTASAVSSESGQQQLQALSQMMPNDIFLMPETTEVDTT